MRPVKRRLAALESERDGLLERRRGAVNVVEGLANTIHTQSAFEAAIGDLDGLVPITLLPVRIETRFTPNGRTLRVRIFPDTVHQDGHEPELTAEETDAAIRYWKTRWEGGGTAQDRAAWRELARAFRPTRARWLVESMTPTNLPTLGTVDPVFPEPAQRPSNQGESRLDPRHVHPTGDEARAFKACPSTK